MVRLQAVYGEGVQNYMNDAPVDVGAAHRTPATRRGRSRARSLPLFGLVAFIDFNWSEQASSAIGYSFLEIDNSNGQAANAFSKGDYALANILFYPAKGVMFGPEIQYGPAQELPRRLRVGRPADPVLGQVQLRPSLRRKLT